MKARYCAMIALVMTFLVAFAFAAIPASADPTTVDVTVDCSAVQNVGCSGSPYPVEVGSNVDINLQATNGYYFVKDSVITYECGGDPQTTTVSSNTQSLTLCNTGSVTEAVTYHITSVVPALKNTCDVTVDIDDSVKCSTAQPVYPIAYNSTGVITFTPSSGYRFNTTSGTVQYSLNGVQQTDRPLVSGEESSFNLDIGTVTEDTTLEITSVSVSIIPYTVTISIGSGLNIHTEHPTYDVNYGSTTEIWFIADDGYYFKCGTKVTIQQGTEDISYTTLFDTVSFPITTKTVTGDVTITVSAVSEALNTYVAKTSSNPFGTTFYSSLSSNPLDPTLITEGELILLSSASGYVAMSSNFKEAPEYQYNATKLIQADGSYILFSRAPAGVEIVSGYATRIASGCAGADPQSGEGGTTAFADENASIYAVYENDTGAAVVFTCSSNVWTLTSANYVAYYKTAITAGFYYDLLGTLPSTVEGKIYLCSNASGSFDVKYYSTVYQGSTLSPTDNGVVFKTLGSGSDDKISATATIVSGYITSASVTGGSSVESDGNVYVNNATTSKTLTFTSGLVSSGAVCEIYSAFERKTYYYLDESAVFGANAVVRSGDIVTFYSTFTVSSGTVISDVRLISSGSTHKVYVKGGDATMTVTNGIIINAMLAEQGMSLLTEFNSVTVAEMGSSPVEVIMNAAGEDLSTVNIGGSAVAFTSVPSGGSSTTSFNVVNSSGVTVDIYNSGSNLFYEKPDGDAVILAHTSGGSTTLTLCSANDAITNAVSGDDIRIYGNANTTPSRDSCMGSSVTEPDWSFLKVLKAGVKVNGEVVNETSKKYVHILDGELYVVKYHGYENNSKLVRWLYYETGNILYEYSGAVQPSGTFYYETKYYAVETPGDTVTYVQYNTTEYAPDILTDVKVFETHRLTSWAYNESFNFYERSRGGNLETVILDGMTYVAHKSFYGCPNLRSVYFDGYYVSSYSFRECTALEEFVSPNMIRVDSCAFYGCTSLKEIHADGTDTSTITSWYVDSYAFQNCTSLESASFGMATRLYYRAFMDCTNLRTVDIPNVKTIDSEIFRRCTNLHTVNMPNVETIASYAFNGCAALEDLYLPKVTSIDYSAFAGEWQNYGTSRTFWNGPSFRSVYAPMLTYLGDTAFGGCTNLETISCPNLDSINSYAFQRCSSLISFEAPLLNKSNASYVFEGCTSLTTFSANSMPSIGSCNFYNCVNLRTVDAAAVQTIGDSAFRYCVNLEYAYFPNVTTINNYAFTGTLTSSGTTYLATDPCKRLKYLYAPMVKTIGYAVFVGCESLEEVVVTDLTSMGQYAFHSCSALKAFDAPNLTSGSSYMFVHCTSLKTVNMPNIGTLDGRNFYECSALETANVAMAQNIGSYEFYKCTALTAVDTTHALNIRDYAFWGCTSLTKIIAREATTVMNNAFEKCSSLTEADLELTQTVQGSAFLDCSALVNLNIPSVTFLYGSCFKNTAVTDVSIGTSSSHYPGGAIIIMRDNVFANCKQLLTLTMGGAENVSFDTRNGSTSSYQSQFSGCTKLTTVHIYDITDVSPYMFYQCSDLDTCTIDSAERIWYYSFNSSGVKTLNIGTVSDYIGRTDYNGYPIGANQLKTLNVTGNINCIKWYAFYGFSSLTSVTLKNVNEIQRQAFQSCTSMTTFKAGTLGTVGDYAFSGCKSLVTVSYTSATSLGIQCFYDCQNLKYFNSTEANTMDLSNTSLPMESTYCFYNCKGIQYVNLGSNVTYLPNYCFNSCTAMKTITGTGVTYVGIGALYNCSALTTITLHANDGVPVTFNTYDNYPFWHATSSVSFGGFQVTSNLGRSKTLTLTNCTILTNNTASTSWMGMSGSQGGSSNDNGFTHVVINSGVSIGRNAFNASSLLKDVTIAANLSIDQYAFYNCSSLENVYGGQNITSIGQYGFAFCWKMQNIYDDEYYTTDMENRKCLSIPNATVIEDYALYQCYSITSVSSYYQNTTYGGQYTEIYAPSVKAIGEGSVMSYQLTKVTLGALHELHETSFGQRMDTVTDKQYYPCMKLVEFICASYIDTDHSETAVDMLTTDMFIPEDCVSDVYLTTIGVTGSMSIGTQFQGDEHLTHLILGSPTVAAEGFKGSYITQLDFVGNASVGSNAFEDCVFLTNVTVDGSPTLGTFCFKNCTALQTFTATDESAPVFAADVFNGCTAMNTFYVLNLPSIADRLFAGLTGLTKINSNKVGYAILNNAETIGATPFTGITLTHIEMDSLLSVNSNVFSGMTEVTYLSLASADDITDDALSNLTKISYLNISGMRMITPVIVNNVNKDNHVLQTVKIEGATMISTSAFEGCTKLKYVYLNTADSSGKVTVGNNAFKDCTALTNIDLKCVSSISDYAFSGSAITSVNMPYVKQIGNYSFYDCASLSTVVIQDCSKFGVSCFSCSYDSELGTGTVSGLESITLNSSSTVLSQNMFKNCQKLKYVNSTTKGTVNLSTVILIGEAAFSGCKSITSVIMPDDMYEIGNYSFDGCSSLIDVTTGTSEDGLTIGNYSFRNCSKLASLSFDSVTEIGDNAFQNCVYLTVIEMPMLTTMGDNAFDGCTGLTNVIMDQLTEVPTNSFKDCTQLKVVSMNNLKTVGPSAFYNCTNMDTFGGNIGELMLQHVKYVRDYAFYNCTKFTSIDFGVYVIQIGNYSFYNMPNVSSIILPNSLQSIGNYAFNAFNGENHFTTVSIPSSVVSIGTEAFATMQTVTIYLNGDITDTSIGSNAFVSNANVKLYMWKEFATTDVSSFVSGMSITRTLENHAKVFLSSTVNDTEVTYNSGVLMNDGYFILPYGEYSGGNRTDLYFCVSSTPSGGVGDSLALLKVANKYNSSNIAKSGDAFRPVVTFTMSDDINTYYVGCGSSEDMSMARHLEAKMIEGVEVQSIIFTAGDYHYRDVVTLPTFIDTYFDLSTIYGDNAIYNINNDKAIFYTSEEGGEPGTITLGYIENYLIMTVKKFAATVNWIVEGTTWKSDTIYYGDAVGTLPEPPLKSGYHYVCWSTVPGQEAFAIDETYVINNSTNYFYAVYSPNSYTVNISTDSISGSLETLSFTIKGVFSFTINPLDDQSMPIYGLITYTDLDHTSETTLFDARTWKTGYDFYQYGFSGTSITSKTVTYNDDMRDGDTFEITLVMKQHKYTINLQFCYQPIPGTYEDLAYSQIRIDPFYSSVNLNSYSVVEKVVSGIPYSDLNDKIIVTTPLYESDSQHTKRYTYSSATNLTNGKALNVDENARLYVNYESFKDSGGVYGDSITIRYVFEEGMYNIKYIYKDDTDSEYVNPSTVRGLEGSVFISGIGNKVKTGYTFVNWVLLDSEGNPTTSYFEVNDSMLLSQDVINCADSSNTISLQAVWSANTVTVKYDLGEYTEVTVPSRTAKTDETFSLPTESTFQFNRSGYVMSGWTLVDQGTDILTTLNLNQSVYGTYVQDNTLTLYAHWSVKTYTFAVQHQDDDHPDAPGLNRYTNKYSYVYLTNVITLWEADTIDASEQFSTLKSWTCSATDDEMVTYTVTFSPGANTMSETIWQTIAKIAKLTGSDTLNFEQVWDNKTFLLYFDTDDGGYISHPTIGPLSVGESFDVLSGDGLSKHGYTFQGWYCGTDRITVYTENLDPLSDPKYELTNTMAAMADSENMLTFTAVWVQSSYTIEYVLGGGVATGVLPRTAYYDTQIEISYPTRSGYEFKGWTGTGITSSAQYKNGDKWSTWDGTAVLSKSFCYLTWDVSTVTLTALWQQTTYTIVYNTNGGSGTVGSGTESATIGDKFTLPELLDAKKTGYTFAGWSYDKINVYTNTSGKFNEELAAAADGNNVVTMYAIWNPITYELWYNYNGNTSGTYVKITARYDEAVKIEHLDRTGFSFDGWTSTDAKTETSKYSTTGEGDNWVIWSNPSYPVNASYFKNLAYEQEAVVHLVATYTALTYHVLYDANGGTGEVPTDVATYNVGDKFTLASYETLVGTNGEKSIVGWSTDRNATTASSVTTFNETVALAADSTNTVTFYAVWVENGCLIKVDLGDATPSYVPSGWKQQEDTGYYVKQVEYGSSVKEAMADWDNVTISKEGYVFSSWSYSASTAIADVTVTCNFEKVENNLLYIFIGVFVAIVIAIVIISRIER